MDEINKIRPGVDRLRDLERHLVGLEPGPVGGLHPINPRNLVEDSPEVEGFNSGKSYYAGQEQWLDDVLRDTFPASDPVPFQR